MPRHSLFALKGDFDGILQVKADPDRPLETRFSISRDEKSVLECSGSRYTPANLGEGLREIKDKADRILAVGKPCDIAGIRKAATMQGSVESSIKLTVSVFCAGTPSTTGTLRMFDAMGIEAAQTVRKVDYRGDGWPGNARVVTATGTYEMTYKESWGGILQKHRQWRCRICPDHTGQFADISLGDLWEMKSRRIRTAFQ